MRLTTGWKRGFGELALIVLGVLIALAANSWWEERSERRLERVYLVQLLADLRETEVRLHQSIAGDSANLSYVERFLELAEVIRAGPDAATVSVPPVDTLGNWAITAYHPFVPVSGTFMALQTGNAHLVRSDSVRLQLLSYAAAVSAAQATLSLTETQTWRNSELVNLAFWKHAIDGRRATPPHATQASASLLFDPEVLNPMTMQRQVGRNRLATLGGLVEPTARFKQLLESELGGR